jgi:hypothetical protein
MKPTTHSYPDPEKAARRLIKHAHAVALLFILGTMPTLSEELSSNKQRVCISRELPEKVITIGFTPFTYVNLPRYQTDKSWFQQVKDLFWRLRFPADSVPTTQALDRPEITTQIYQMVLYPQMVWAGPVDADLRSRLGKLLPTEAPPQGDCLQYAELSPRDVAERQILIEVTSPAFAPPWNPPRIGDCEDEAPVRRAIRTPELDFDNFKACRYDQVSLGMIYNVAIRYFGPDATYPPLSCPVQPDPVNCVMLLHRDGWPFYVRFSKNLIQEWRPIADAMTTFFDKVTLSRDEISVAKIDRRP